MSGESAQQKAAGEQSLWQAQLAQQLSGIAMPELSALTGRLGGMLGSRDETGRMSFDADALMAGKGELNRAYDQAGFGTSEAMKYRGLSEGFGRLNPGAMSSGLMSAATTGEQQRMAALRNLEFMSAQSSMQDFNKVMQQLGLASNQALGLAGGFSGAAGQAIGGLSNQSQFGNAVGGLVTGAGLGSTFGVPGAIVGGVVGLGAGLLSNP